MFMALLRQHHTFHGKGKAHMEQQDGGGASTIYSYFLVPSHLSSDSKKDLSLH